MNKSNKIHVHIHFVVLASQVSMLRFLHEAAQTKQLEKDMNNAPLKINMTVENLQVEHVSPIKDGDFTLPCSC